MDNQKKQYNDDAVVTVGILKEVMGSLEGSIVKSLQEFRAEFDQHVEVFNEHLEDFKKHSDATARSFGYIMKRFDTTDEALAHGGQTVATFDGNLVRHDREISALDERVLQLELAK
jgi:hypothetical protein